MDNNKIRDLAGNHCCWHRGGAGGDRTHDLTDYETVIHCRITHLHAITTTAWAPKLASLALVDCSSHPHSHPKRSTMDSRSPSRVGSC